MGEETMGEDEEPRVTPLNLGVAVMLLGSMGFIMALCYLMFHPDKDIRLYSWQVICSTISIFVAVLIFQASAGVVEYLGFDGETFTAKVLWRFFWNFVWFMILQVLLAWVARAIGPAKRREMPSDHEKREEMMEHMELDMKCWATLLGHITGFSSIHAWCTLQQGFSDSLIGTIAVIPVAFGTLWGIHIFLDYLREKWAEADGYKDEFETIWDEEVEETMEDVMGLTFSFLIVQSLRFAFAGMLPNDEGNYPPDFIRSFPNSAGLFIVGVALQLFGLLVRTRGKGSFITTMSFMVCNFSFAWIVMFAVEASMERWGLVDGDDDVLGLVVCSLVVTAFSFALIFVMDKIADTSEKGASVHSTVMAFVTTLGILIGFSWEKCFDVSVSDIAIDFKKQTHGFEFRVPPAFTKLGLALLLALSTIPAWRYYILPIVFAMGGFEKPEEEEEEEEDEEEASGSPFIGLLEPKRTRPKGAAAEAAGVFSRKKSGGGGYQPLSGGEAEELAEARKKMKEHHQHLTKMEETLKEEQEARKREIDQLTTRTQEAEALCLEAVQHAEALRIAQAEAEAEAASAAAAAAAAGVAAAAAAAAAAAPPAPAAAAPAEGGHVEAALRGQLKALKEEKEQLQEMFSMAMQQREDFDQSRKQVEAAHAVDVGRLEAQDARILGLEHERQELASLVEVLRKQAADAASAAAEAAAAAEEAERARVRASEEAEAAIAAATSSPVSPAGSPLRRGSGLSQVSQGSPPSKPGSPGGASGGGASGTAQVALGASVTSTSSRGLGGATAAPAARRPGSIGDVVSPASAKSGGTNSRPRTPASNAASPNSAAAAMAAAALGYPRARPAAGAAAISSGISPRPLQQISPVATSSRLGMAAVLQQQQSPQQAAMVQQPLSPQQVPQLFVPQPAPTAMQPAPMQWGPGPPPAPTMATRGARQ